MRADRLLSLLLLLQARGRMTAAQLARELECSPRTIYRDIDALSAAGVPVYGDPGPAGGYALLDSYRTTLTGLNEGEVRALFMRGIPGPLMQLGMGRDLQAALRKLSAALPDAQREGEGRVRQRFYLDPTGWTAEEEPVPHLTAVHAAVRDDRLLEIAYRIPSGGRAEGRVAPYGLAAKAGAWYLVCASEDRLRVHRVSDLLDARATEERFEHPAAFDLAEFWKGWCEDRELQRVGFTATVRVSASLIPVLPAYFGHGIRDRIGAAAPPDAEGRIMLTLSFESFYHARDRLLAFGRALEVLEPEPLRRSILDFAEQTVELYHGASPRRNEETKGMEMDGAARIL
jgi:predicted DNA-binding transcriptional regulator YafY